ncbi:MAG: tRNA (guanosine(37)-N1)-methyltransferase TrmD [Planctomycetota bacterium]|jgi:tRNA (guanine37-N1)-methyltransferase
MRIDVITLFPEVFEGFLDTSIPRIAREKGLVEVRLHNLRDYAEDERGTVDDRPYGGGPGMVLLCEPVFAAAEDVLGDDSEASLIMLCPQGEKFNQAIAEELSKMPRLVLLAGHYEGFDERIKLGLSPREISIGDYVLSGGEVPAMVLMDAVIRLIPGALGDERSAREDSFSQGLLEYPQYTRPRDYRGMQVPEVLLSGNHGLVAKWRAEQALERTKARRRDLLADKKPKEPDGERDH